MRTVDRLPQIFWDDGQPWPEANLFSLEVARNREVKIETLTRLMEHLHKYAIWLEQEQIDWRHFPQTKAERVLERYRGELVDSRDHGYLRPSTTTARMRAAIRFYRYAAGRQFISRDAPKWQDKAVVVRYFDTAGFERTMNRLTTDLSIPNRARPGLRLEDGLLPISRQHMTELLQFAKENCSEELHLMLMVGFFTGARLGTITTLRVQALEDALRDPDVSGMWSIPVGPGTGIATKFDVEGHLMIPDEWMTMLKKYAASPRRLDRVIKAPQNMSYLFLTRHSNPYSVAAVDREMVTLRRSGQAAGLKFLQAFKFHQTRATFGTWLATICLEKASVKASVEFVKRAMHHKDASTTFRYITFIEHTEAKIEVANAFTQAFLGLQTR
ncbi:tyrosine-type recombinase/integrase [Aromatoleum evansii]|uniref:tyrosine-type recombinase/integrase n=1 Tax=Aromatoleum evansii TaxID=59406 RepID=UPI00145E393A|nr:tyrosine-type recombinase/integrase [Aromatoleum evansii]